MADQKYNLLKNVVFSTITTFSTSFLFILLIFVGRFTGVEQNGIFNTALAVATIFEMFIDLGLRDLSVRNVSRNRTLTAKYVGNLLTWKLILCALVYLVMLLVVNLYYNFSSEVRIAIYILTISAFLKSLKYTFRIFFQAHDLFAYDTALVLMERTSVLVFGLIVLIVYRSLFAFIICFTVVRAVDFLITLLILNFKIVKIRPRFEFRFLLKLQKDAIPLGMFFIILTVFSYIDIVMLSKMSPNFNAAGLYSAAFRIYEGITILPTILFLVALPKLSELYLRDQSKHFDLSVRVIKYMFIMAMPVVVYGYFFSDFLIKTFYSSRPEFFESIFALQTLFIGILFQYPNWMLNTILISIDKQKIIMIIGIFGLVFKIILNLFAIPYFGYEGAAGATVCGEALIFSLSTIYLAWHRIKIPVLKISIKPLLVSVILSTIFYFGLKLISLIPLGALLSVVYLGLLFLFKAFDVVEINGLRENLVTVGKKFAK